MTTHPDICVIVPTIRHPDCVRAYVQNARSHGFNTDRLHFLILTEDFCDISAIESMLERLEVRGGVYDESTRRDWFDTQEITEYTHLIPEASHAQTSFGLLYMWANETFKFGVFIDDDTAPHDECDFFGQHLRNLSHGGRMPTAQSDAQWVNVLYQSSTDLYPRGYPYQAMDAKVNTVSTDVDTVVASQGLWTNVPDLDAVRILMDGDLNGQAKTRTTSDDYKQDFTVAEGQYLTVCSMNLAFRREIIPAFYQFPMDDNQWEVGRFDDIWSGVLLKRAVDLQDKTIYNGAPLCAHNKAPRSTFGDLANEVAGLELNEHFWEVIDAVNPERESYRGTAVAVGKRLEQGDFSSWQNGAFLNHCGTYLLDWLDCLEAITSHSANPSATEVIAGD